jgi:hypothetical protein
VSDSPIVSAPDGIRSIMAQAIALYRGRFLLYLGLIAIPAVPVGIAMVVLAALARDPAHASRKITLISAAAEYLLELPLAQAFVAYAVANSLTGRQVTFSETLRAVLPQFGALVGTVILASLAIGLGLILIIIPGLVLGLWFQFTGQVVILEHLTYWRAMRRCFDLVRGSFWRTVRDLLVIGIVGGIATVLIVAACGGFATSADARTQLVVPQIAGLPATILVLPFSTIALTLVFLRLRRLRPLR